MAFTAEFQAVTLPMRVAYYNDLISHRPELQPAKDINWKYIAIGASILVVTAMVIYLKQKHDKENAVPQSM